MQTVFYTSFIDALKDCLSVVPFLFLIFFGIEILEYYYSDKILSPSRFSKKAGPLIGVILASIPQCGLSVIASTMYIKRLITKGTLIAVYLATSDEAIPVLLSNPESFKIVLPLILVKIVAGLVIGYLIDLFFPSKINENDNSDIVFEKGCHSHSIAKEACTGKLELLLHPIIHTVSVSFFILVITLLINIAVYAVQNGGFSLLNMELFKNFFQNSFIQPVLMSFFGLIPNCAVSVGITVMYLKGLIGFASCISGLCASAGLGILVLIRNNKDFKDTLNVVFLLFLASALTGLSVLIIQTVSL